MARSPYLEAKVNRWSEDKKELVIEDCDPVTFNILVDYMYGMKIPKSVISPQSFARLGAFYFCPGVLSGYCCVCEGGYCN